MDRELFFWQSSVVTKAPHGHFLNTDFVGEILFAFGILQML
jgi:hypothetical protein